MGFALSRLNNKLTFDYETYVLERDELARLLRDISSSAACHRQRKGALQVVNGASGVAAGVAGAVAIVTAPVAFGLSLPATAAIIGNSIAAASVASSAASCLHGRLVDGDIEQRLKNLRCLIDGIARKDEEINSLLTCLRKGDASEPAVKACRNLGRVWEEWDLSATDERKSMAYDLPVSVLKSQGIFFGTRSIIEGSKQVREEDDLESALACAADAIDEETAIVRKLEDRFRYLSCLPGERTIPRGRLTYVDGGGGCSRIMVVTFFDDMTRTTSTLKSDSTNVIRLPERATDVKVHFEVKGGKTVKKVDRPEPKQPWVKSAESGKYETDVLDFDRGDGVDAAFVVKGSIAHSFVHKAWDFARHPSVEPRRWEWWENAGEECRELLPEIEARSLNRTRREDEPCAMDLCGSCFGQDALLAPVA